jgi:hypothetical protein
MQFIGNGLGSSDNVDESTPHTHTFLREYVGQSEAK